MDAYEEIRRLIYAYPKCIDRGDLAGVARLFADARVVFGSGREVLGEEALRQWFDNTVVLYEGGATHVHHLVGNVTVDFEDASHATAMSYYQTCQAVPPDFPLQLIIAGRYQDRFGRVDGRWRFVERRFLREFVGDTSYHVRPLGLAPVET